MKKLLTAFGAGLAGAIGLTVLTGHGFLLKAIGKNLTKKPFTPSIDDAQQFPFHTVSNSSPRQWERDGNYNKIQFSEDILKNLEDTKASCLLIVKDGKLLHEQYWNGHNAASQMNSFSMAKGILGLLVGFAIEEGKIKGEEQLFSDFYPEYAEDEFGKHLTLKNLLQMQAGLDWDEEYHHPFAPNSKQYFVKDLAAQVFERKLKEMPGRKYEYQSAAPQLLGFALRKAVGENLANYLSKKLWIPLGMEYPGKWTVDEKGMEKTFCCIHATARDFAKLGWMVLNDGSYFDKEILSADFIKRTKTPTIQNDAFGYTLWVNQDCSTPHYFLYGFLGQFIIMIPEKQMVIVKTGHDNNLPVDDKLRPLQVDFLVKEICRYF